MESVAHALIGLYALVASALVVPRGLRRLRAARDDELRQRWRSLPEPRRRALKQALVRGRAIDDPAEAELAIRSVEQGEEVVRLMRPFELVYLPILLAFLVLAAVTGDRWFAVAIVCALVLLGLLQILSSWRRARLRAAVEATRRRRPTNV